LFSGGVYRRLSHYLVFVLIIFGIGIIGVSEVWNQQAWGVSGEITASGAGCNAPEATWSGSQGSGACTFKQFDIPASQSLIIRPCVMVELTQNSSIEGALTLIMDSSDCPPTGLTIDSNVTLTNTGTINNDGSLLNTACGVNDTNCSDKTKFGIVNTAGTITISSDGSYGDNLYGSINNNGGTINILHDGSYGNNVFSNNIYTGGTVNCSFNSIINPTSICTHPNDQRSLVLSTVNPNSCPTLDGKWTDVFCTISDFTIKPGNTLTVTSGVTLNVQGILTNNGAITYQFDSVIVGNVIGNPPTDNRFLVLSTGNPNSYPAI